MDNKPQKPNPTRSAAQKIADLENAIMALYGVADSLAKENATIKTALKLLDNKVSALVKASGRGLAINDETLEQLMVENNVEDLKSRVTKMVQDGVVVAEESVSPNSFLVASEHDETGKVISPRIQFALKAIKEEYQTKLVGTKVGDTVLLEEGKLSVKVLESYKINSPQAAPEAEAPTEETQSTQDTAPQANS